MVVCDICGAPGTGTLVSSNDMRKAVNRGFNPFALGLANAYPFLSQSQSFDSWKMTIVFQDSSDWNICPRCMSKLRPNMGGEPKPTGVTKATVSTAPLAVTVATAMAEKQMREASPQKKEAEPEKPKKKWRFWKK